MELNQSTLGEERYRTASFRAITNSRPKSSLCRRGQVRHYEEADARTRRVDSWDEFKKAIEMGGRWISSRSTRMRAASRMNIPSPSGVTLLPKEDML